MVERLLEVLPSVIRATNDELEIDVDFCENLRLYLDNFDHVTVACPVTTDIRDSGLRRCRPVKDLPWRDRVQFISLPNAYRLRDFLRHYHAFRRVLKTEIEQADYLVFSPHALAGDWPTVAIREAIKLQRPYVIEADVVYEKVAQVGWARNSPWKLCLKKNLTLPLFQMSHRHCLEHSSLALLQGQDVYDAYSPFCRKPHKVYHMPVSKVDYITESQLKHKLDDLDDSRALRLCYIGRAIDMKGPMDWLETLHALIKSGVAISATWLGDGSLLTSMQVMAEKLGIADSVKFPGFISDR
jgi:glycosyltransferase involved in cell wall biosynthesis